MAAVTVTAWMSPLSCSNNHHTSIRTCPQQRNNNINIQNNPCREETWLRVLSQDVDVDVDVDVSSESSSLHTEDDGEDNKKVSYAIERGDGSTGGGGLPMPQQRRDSRVSSSENIQGDEEEDDDEEDEELRRPKVSAEMPLG